MTARYSAGWNMPGYMPDCEPSIFDSFASAKQYIIDELLFMADSYEDERSDELDNAAQDVNLCNESFSIFTDRYVFWVEEVSE